MSAPKETDDAGVTYGAWTTALAHIARVERERDLFATALSTIESDADSLSWVEMQDLARAALNQVRS